jgi:hypothetical protein
MKPHWHSRALFASVLALSPTPLLAKNNNPTPADNGGSSKPHSTTPAVPETLDNLGDAKLMSELAARNLDSLLDRYFDIHKTPEAEQKGIKSMGALRDLSNPKLSNGEKEKRVRQIVEGVHTTMGTLDPEELFKDAALLMYYGTERDLNLLEYWGENPATEARLRPTAQAVYDMLGAASKGARAKASAIEPLINTSNQSTLGVQWDKLDKLSGRAEYNQMMMAYVLAMTLPKAAREKLVDKSVAYLTDIDNKDSEVMPQVHLMLGKLNLIAGKYDEAIKFLDAVASSDKSIEPAPELKDVYTGKYFGVVARLKAGKIPDATKGLADLEAWQKKSMPNDPETLKSTSAATELLRYRIQSAVAKKATGEAKKTAEAAADKILLDLSAKRPDLRPIIFQQLVERLPKDAPLKGLDPLLLQGLMAKGYGEAVKPDAASRDHDVMKRGLAAADEVVSRKDAANLPAQLRDEAGRLRPVLLEALGQKIEAAQAYLKYAIENATYRAQYAQDELENAGVLTFELRKSSPDDAQVVALYDQFLPVAINPPFNKVQLAYYYADRLQRASKPAEAIKYYRLVAKSDRNYNSAQFHMMQAMQDQLDEPKLVPAVRTLLIKDLMAQTEKVRESYKDAKDDAGRERYAIATLTAAETAGAELKQPKQTLELLNGFNEAVKGTPDEKLLISRSLLAQVNANMAVGNLNDATTTLRSLLEHSGGEQGAAFVRGLLDKLDKSLDKAQAAHDTKEMADIAASEASLSGYLVNWAKTNTNAEIKKFTYQYMVFDARTQRLAGELASDPAKKQELLQKAMASYKTLQDPESVAMYKETLNPDKVKSGSIDPTAPDPTVRLGVGLTDFQLKNYKEAAEILGELLNSGKLGNPELATTDANGDPKDIPNETYWESTYKFYAASAEAYANDPTAMAGTKQGLKNVLIRGGIPEKWQEPFEALRKQLVPDFDVAALAAATSQPAMTQPIK